MHTRVAAVGPMSDLPPLTPDPAFRLSGEERARLRPDYDADALERLLAHLSPDMRPEILESCTDRRYRELPRFRLGPQAPPLQFLPMQLDNHRFSDPRLQALTDAVRRAAP